LLKPIDYYDTKPQGVESAPGDFAGKVRMLFPFINLRLISNQAIIFTT